MHKDKVNPKGFLMIELLVSLAVLMLLMSLLLPMVKSNRDQLDSKTEVIERIALKEAVVDHFQAQLSSILWRACANPTDKDIDELVQQGAGWIEIGTNTSELPERLTTKDLPNSTDWLQAYQRGICRYSIRIDALSEELPYTCSWDEGDEVLFEYCDDMALGMVENVSSTKTDVTFYDDAIVGEMGTILSHDPYIWYLNDRSTYTAFWRTPQVTGNSLELWAGVEKLAIYPLLDTNSDGRMDTLSADYGAYALWQVKGFWLEVVVTDNSCDDEQTDSSYNTHRGETWSYASDCSFPLQLVVNP